MKRKASEWLPLGAIEKKVRDVRASEWLPLGAIEKEVRDVLALTRDDGDNTIDEIDDGNLPVPAVCCLLSI